MDQEEQAPQEEEVFNWDRMAPVELPLIWQNQIRIVTYHVLTGQEEQDLVARKNEGTNDPEVRLLEEGFIRLAASVIDFDGHSLDTEFEAKLAYVRSWPTPLIDTLLAHYSVAMVLPLVDPTEPLEGE